MKKLTSCISFILALVLGLTVCCAGLAEEETAYNKYVESYFTELLKLIPGGENVDWEGFAKSFEEKFRSGAVITLEDCLPPEGWQFIGTLMLMEEDGKLIDQKDLPYTTNITVKGNTISAVHQLKEQLDESAIPAVQELIKSDFEGELSLSYLKVYLDKLAEMGVNKTDIKMTAQYLNADGTVIEEAAHTYADLDAAVMETLQFFYANLFSLIPNPDKVDWDAFVQEFDTKAASGAKITLEDCLPKESWNLLDIMMRMDNYTSQIISAEDLPFTVDVTVTGNHFETVHQLKEKMGELTAGYLIAGIRADYEDPVGLADMKGLYDLFGYAGVDLGDITMSVKYLDVDGAVLYQNNFTFTDLVIALIEAGMV